MTDRLQVSNDMNEVVPSTVISNSTADILIRAGGKKVEKEITLSANNTTASENIFQVTGTVEILAISGEITDTTTLVNLTAGYLELDDGTAQSDITASGIVLSGLAVGTFFVKNGLAAATLDLADNATGVIIEAAADKKTYQSFFITQKASTNTYIRWTYSTTDAPINAKICWHVHYISHNGGTIVAV